MASLHWDKNTPGFAWQTAMRGLSRAHELMGLEVARIRGSMGADKSGRGERGSHG